MTMNKKILAVAIVSGLFATSANAQVTITGAAVPVTIASEVVATSGAPAIIQNTANALNIITPLNYAFSNGEVRYARIECTNGLLLNAGSVPTYQDDVANVQGTVTLGAVNGSGTSAVSFSVTATSAGVGDEALTDTFTLSGNRTLVSNTGSVCTYGLYDQPSQASAGGLTGRIASSAGTYLNSPVSGYLFASTGNTSTANVEVTPAFSQFTTVGSNPGVNTTTARLAVLNQNVRAANQLFTNGSDITLGEIFAAATNISIAGDFTAAQNADGTYNTAAARGRVFLADNDDCTGTLVPSSTLTQTTATFTIGNAAVVNRRLCISTLGTVAIPAATYTATLNAVSATPGVVAPANTGPLAAGEIIRNGTELQAPFVQLPVGYISRMVLTNTGTVARTYSIRIMGEDGNTIVTNSVNMNGSVAANGTRVLDLNTLFTSFSTQPRATLVVTVAGPTNQIQGLYQIVRPDTGAISNHVMVRPGTN